MFYLLGGDEKARICTELQNNIQKKAYKYTGDYNNNAKWLKMLASNAEFYKTSHDILTEYTEVLRLPEVAICTEAVRAQVLQAEEAINNEIAHHVLNIVKAPHPRRPRL